MAEQHGKALVPQIRFAGFTDPWEQRKLGEVAPLQRGFDLPVSQMISGPYPVVMSNGVGGWHSKYAVKGPGVVTGRSGTIGGLQYIEGDFWPHNTSLWVTSFNGNEPKFIYWLYSSLNLERFGSGSGVPTLNRNDVHDQLIGVPCNIVEQRRIGAFFDRLDSLITLHQRKYDKLCVLKKSMLDKMFPKGGSLYPEIRFAGFTDPWEQRKLGEVAHFINGRAYSQNELLSSGKYPVLRVGNFYTNDSWYYSNLELEDKNYAYEGDLLYTWSATFGPHIWHGNKVIYHYHIWKVQLEAALEKLFAFQLLERDKERILSDKNGSTMVHITKTGIENTSVLMPCSVEEQRRIGAFFDRLDSLITLHQRKLELLRNIKKSMLDKMFV